jgi:hypothetical protein
VISNEGRGAIGEPIGWKAQALDKKEEETIPRFLMWPIQTGNLMVVESCVFQDAMQSRYG